MYSFNISSFTSGLDVGQFTKEIKNQIPTKLITTSNRNNKINIRFDTTLTTEEENVLNNLISTHSPIEVIPQGKFAEFYINLHPYVEFSTTPDNVVLSYYYYSGAVAANGALKSCYILHNGKYTGVDTGYQINLRVRDVTNGTIIFDETLSGTPNKNSYYAIPQHHIVSSLTNIPEKEALFEFSYRLTSGSKGRIYIVHMY